MVIFQNPAEHVSLMISHTFFLTPVLIFTLKADFLLVTKFGSSTKSSPWSRVNETSMGHIIRNHQMLDMGSEQGLSHLHPNHHVCLGNSVNYRNESTHPVLRVRWNSAVHLQFIDPCRTNCVHASHFNGMQHHQSVSSNYVGEVPLANFYNPHMPSS